MKVPSEYVKQNVSTHLVQAREAYIIGVRLGAEVHLAHAICNTLDGRCGSCCSRRSHFRE